MLNWSYFLAIFVDTGPDENALENTNKPRHALPYTFPRFFSSTTVSKPQACTEGTQASGALYQICPAAANDKLVVYAHGYVSPNEPLAIPAEWKSGEYR